MTCLSKKQTAIEVEYVEGLVKKLKTEFKNEQKVFENICHNCHGETTKIVSKKKNEDDRNVISTPLGNDNICSKCTRRYCRSCLRKTYDETLCNWTENWVCAYCKGTCYCFNCLRFARTLTLKHSLNIPVDGLPLKMKQMESKWFKI